MCCTLQYGGLYCVWGKRFPCLTNHKTQDEKMKIEDLKHIKEGAVFQSRTGSQYHIKEVMKSGFLVQSLTGKKPVKISMQAIKKTIDRLQAGEELVFQKNTSNGGISYTVAIEAGVVFACQNHLIVDKKSRVFRGVEHA